MPEFNKLRFNEPLLGRIIASKRTNPDNFKINNNLLLMSTVLPDIKFNSIPEWINHIHIENKYK